MRVKLENRIGMLNETILKTVRVVSSLIFNSLKAAVTREMMNEGRDLDAILDFVKKERKVEFVDDDDYDARIIIVGEDEKAELSDGEPGAVVFVSQNGEVKEVKIAYAGLCE